MDAPTNTSNVQTVDELTEPVILPVEAYVSEAYARAERDKLWTKVWLQAGRMEDIPAVGDFITYDICDDSILIVRTAPDKITAFHNFCLHRGRRLVDTPPGKRNAKGRTKQFVCGYHGWRYGLDGEATHIQYKDDWKGTLTKECTTLPKVNCDTWGGWIWINLDPNCEPLLTYLGPAATLLEPFQLHRMRPRWRKWGIFDCNWKVAMEAFYELYHLEATHPEFNKWVNARGWARVKGRHSHIGYDASDNMQEQKSKARIGDYGDPRISTAELLTWTWEQANTNTTQTMVDVALTLKDKLPEGTPPEQVLKYWLETSRRNDAERGVFWPEVDPEAMGESGTAWQIFPNQTIGHGINNMLCYQARPYGTNPDKCYFEGAVYELFPEGKEPKTEWEFGEPTAEGWCYVLSQDFSNMAAVQRGMKSSALKVLRPNPYMERSVANLHFNLAKYMGSDTGPRKAR